MRFSLSRGTDTANILVINALETAFDQRKSRHGSSWIFRRLSTLLVNRLFASRGDVWELRRLGIPHDIAE